MMEKQELVYNTTTRGLETIIRAIYLVKDNTIEPEENWSLSKDQFRILLKSLPFSYTTAPLNQDRFKNSDDWNHLVAHLMITHWPDRSLIHIFPPKGRRLERGDTNSDQMKPDAIMDDVLECGFRCCYHPLLSYFKIRPRRKSSAAPVEETVEMDIFKFHPDDAYNIYKFLEKNKIPNEALKDIEKYKILLKE